MLERGRRSPTFFVIVQLARALRMQPVALFADAVARLQGESAVMRIPSRFRTLIRPLENRGTDHDPIGSQLGEFPGRLDGTT